MALVCCGMACGSGLGVPQSSKDSSATYRVCDMEWLEKTRCPKVDYGLGWPQKNIETGPAECSQLSSMNYNSKVLKFLIKYILVRNSYFPYEFICQYEFALSEQP